MDRVQIGIDENGLGARLGPLVVTAVAAVASNRWQKSQSSSQDADGQDQQFAHLLDDSKRLVSHEDARLGEAWARAVIGPSATGPAELLALIGIDSMPVLTELCPSHVQPQCWSTEGESFTAPARMVTDVSACLDALRARGLSVTLLRSAWICTKKLNLELSEGRHRFTVDLHSMERLILDLRKRVGSPIQAVCGKVGGIADYPRFFGPLGGRLHTVIEQTKARSAYEFAELGQVSFEQDADAHHPLVMIASLIGKYLRELFMARIARRYSNSLDLKRQPSGYHDPVTNQFVEATNGLRKTRRVPLDCFERRRNG